MSSRIGNIYISPKVLQKLSDKHGVSYDEICQCFENRTGKLLQDKRENHQSDPPTEWIISETNRGRSLKIVFVQRMADPASRIDIRTAYEPNVEEIRIYEKFGKL